jgi:hypothetical protein
MKSLVQVVVVVLLTLLQLLVVTAWIPSRCSSIYTNSIDNFHGKNYQELQYGTNHYRSTPLTITPTPIFMMVREDDEDHSLTTPKENDEETTYTISHSHRRRHMIRYTTSTLLLSMLTTFALPPVSVTNAVGPIKIALVPLKYNAIICPPDRPIPGEKAMIGMRGLCVTVQAQLDTTSPKELEKVGVYGFVNDGVSGDSVLANNPDGGTDAGQFAMIESVTPQDTTVTFEFIAAVPRDKDLSIYDNGIGPLNFSSLRLISYPGGQQFGAISPCEMNEFSDECEEWERNNGPYKKADYMVKSNPRTKGS